MKNISFNIALLVLMLSAVTFLPWTYHATYGKYFLMQAGALVLVAMWFWRRKKILGPSWKTGLQGLWCVNSRGILLFGLFVLWNAFSIGWSDFHLATYYRGIELGFYLLWAIMICAAVSDRTFLDQLFDWWIVIGGVTALLGLTFLSVPEAFRWLTRGEYNQRLIIPFGSPLFAAAFQSLTMPVTVSRIISSIRDNGDISKHGFRSSGAIVFLSNNRKPLFIILGIQLLAFVLTFSLSAFFGIAICALVFLFLFFPRRRVIFLSIIGTVCGLILLAILLVPAVNESVSKYYEEGSMPSRVFGAQISTRLAGTSPIWGVGAGGFFPNHARFSPPERNLYPRTGAYMLHAHNEYLEIFAETGIIGLALFLLGILYTLRPALNPGKFGRSRTSLALAGLSLGVIALLAQDLLSVGLRFWDVNVFFWGALGTVWAGTRLLNPQEQGSPEGENKNVLSIVVAVMVTVAAGWILWSVCLGGLFFQMRLHKAVSAISRFDRTGVPAHQDFAIAAFTKAFNAENPGYNYPDYVIAKDIYGRLVFDVRNFAVAYDVLSDVQKLCPDLDNSVYIMGLVALNRGDKKTAWAHFIHYARNNPFDPACQRSLGLLALQPDFVAQPDGETTASEWTYIEALRLYYKGQYAFAIEKILAVNPEEVRLGLPTRLKARCLIALNRNQEAEAALREHLGRYYADIYARLALAAVVIDDLEAVEKELSVCERMVSGKRDAKEIYMGIELIRGVALTRANDWVSAVAHLEKSAALSQGDKRPHFKLIEAYLMTNKKRAALKIMDQLIAMSRGDERETKRVQVFCFSQMGQYYLRTGAPDMAAKLWESAVKNMPDVEEFYFGLFDIYRKVLKQNDNARRVLNKLISLTKNSRVRDAAQRLLSELDSK